MIIEKYGIWMGKDCYEKRKTPCLNWVRKVRLNGLGVEPYELWRLFQRKVENNFGTSDMWVWILCFKVEKQGRIEEHFEYVDQNLCFDEIDASMHNIYTFIHILKNKLTKR